MAAVAVHMEPAEEKGRRDMQAVAEEEADTPVVHLDYSR